jgi:membrane associated rhomboid family serine protease
MAEPDTSAPATCYRHTDRETGRRCTRCGRPACWECLRDAPVGAHCAECVKAEQAPMGEQVTRSVRSLARDPLLVTKIIVGLNIAVFALELTQGSGFGGFLGSTTVGKVEVHLGLFAPSVAAGQWYRLVTSGFIHFGVIHILFNMLILYRLGQDMEAGIGRSRFATIYFVSLLAGSFGAVLLDPRALSGGASGAVFGLAAAATIGLWQRGVRFYQTGWGPLLVLNLLITFTLPDISVGAHVGGLIAGTILGWLMLHPRHGVERKTLAFTVAAILAIVSVVGAIAYSRNHYPECVNSTGQQYQNCTS